jgi:hypothetical protein
MRCLCNVVNPANEFPKADQIRLVQKSELLTNVFVTLFKSEQLEHLESAVWSFHGLHGYLQLSTTHLPQNQYPWEIKLVKAGAIEAIANFAGKAPNPISLDYALQDLSEFAWGYYEQIVKSRAHVVAINCLKTNPATAPKQVILGAVRLLSLVQFNGNNSQRIRSILYKAGGLAPVLKFITIQMLKCNQKFPDILECAFMIHSN